MSSYTTPFATRSEVQGAIVGVEREIDNLTGRVVRLEKDNKVLQRDVAFLLQKLNDSTDMTVDEKYRLAPTPVRRAHRGPWRGGNHQPEIDNAGDTPPENTEDGKV